MSAVLEVKPSLLPPGAVGGPAAWKGPQIGAKTDWLTQFTAQDLEEIDAAVRTHFTEGREMGAISPQTFRLPTLAKKLGRLLDQVLHGRGFVMLRGFQVARYTTAESAVAYLGIGSHLGSFHPLADRVADRATGMAAGNAPFPLVQPRPLERCAGGQQQHQAEPEQPHRPLCRSG